MFFLSGRSGIQEEFSQIGRTATKFRNKSEVANLSFNKSKNRYETILPYDHTRVKLKHLSNDNSDYINASHIDSYRQKRKFVVTQAPLESTFVHFWNMVWDQMSLIIVMLSQESEIGQVSQSNSLCRWTIPLKEVASLPGNVLS